MGMAAITRFGRLANERKQVRDAKRRVVRADVPLNPPAPKVLGRDRPDGTRKRLQVYLGGGGIFRPKPPVFDRS